MQRHAVCNDQADAGFAGAGQDRLFTQLAGAFETACQQSDLGLAQALLTLMEDVVDNLETGPSQLQSVRRRLVDAQFHLLEMKYRQRAQPQMQ